MTTRLAAVLLGPWPFWASLIGFIVVVASVVAGVLSVVEPSAKERQVCDQAVSTLLSTTDALELQRAMFLIRRLDCSVRRRL